MKCDAATHCTVTAMYIVQRFVFIATDFHGVHISLGITFFLLEWVFLWGFLQHFSVGNRFRFKALLDIGILLMWCGQFYIIHLLMIFLSGIVLKKEVLDFYFNSDNFYFLVFGRLKRFKL